MLHISPYNYDAEKFKPVQKKNIIDPLTAYDFRNLRDTVYTLKDHFVEVNLLTQYATLYSRDGSSRIIPVSTGTKKIEDGIETREGIFVLQWKAKKMHSVQFDSTLMINWMGFNSGIGFHALEGKSYYKYLGKKNVSHGCVRMTRKDAELLFTLLEKGTPVFVHKGNGAIKIAFTESNDNYKYFSSNELRKSLTERYSFLYSGEYLLNINQKLVIDERNINSFGLPIGDASLIPSRQALRSIYLWISPETPEYEKIKSLLHGDNPGMLTLNLTLDANSSRRKI